MTPEETMARLDEIAACAEEAFDEIAAAYVPDLVALVRHLVAEQDEARSAAARAEAKEFALREEITTAFRRHGLAPGPEAIDGLARERDAYKRAKAENDERFMLERDEARAKRDEALRALRAVLPYAEWCAEGIDDQAVEIKNAEDARAAAGIAIQHALKRSRLAREAARAAAAAVDAAKRVDPDLKLQNVAPDWSTVVLGTTPLHRFLSEARAVANRAAHERPLPNTNEPEDQHVPHAEAEDEP